MIGLGSDKSMEASRLNTVRYCDNAAILGLRDSRRSRDSQPWSAFCRIFSLISHLTIFGSSHYPPQIPYWRIFPYLGAYSETLPIGTLRLHLSCENFEVLECTSEIRTGNNWWWWGDSKIFSCNSRSHPNSSKLWWNFVTSELHWMSSIGSVPKCIVVSPETIILPPHVTISMNGVQLPDRRKPRLMDIHLDFKGKDS